ncbi:MAG TPA: YraN family protein [Candidatus Paceibacterota bacterium]|nr:YraN family protein [Candidatus Paceibacterota bacterium]
MKVFTSDAQKKGKIGEDAVCTYLTNQGFLIVEKNFTRAWGEIDIVARKGGVTHFIEVKAVTHENTGLRPEDQMHSLKQKKLRRMIETYITGRRIGDWQFDVACVYLDMQERRARIKMLSDIILA